MRWNLEHTANQNELFIITTFILTQDSGKSMLKWEYLFIRFTNIIKNTNIFELKLQEITMDIFVYIFKKMKADNL